MLVFREIQVLLAGGGAEEARSLNGIFNSIHTRAHVRHVPDADEALLCLHGTGPSRKAFRANLILLDVDGVPNGGGAMLSKLKADARIAHIPVVMLATHQTNDELRDAYNQGVSCCVSKPVDPKALLRALHVTNEFWLTIAKLPVE